MRKKHIIIRTILNTFFATDTNSCYFSSFGIDKISKEFLIWISVLVIYFRCEGPLSELNSTCRRDVTVLIEFIEKLGNKLSHKNRVTRRTYKGVKEAKTRKTSLSHDPFAAGSMVGNL